MHPASHLQDQTHWKRQGKKKLTGYLLSIKLASKWLTTAWRVKQGCVAKDRKKSYLSCWRRLSNPLRLWEQFFQSLSSLWPCNSVINLTLLWNHTSTTGNAIQGIFLSEIKACRDLENFPDPTHSLKCFGIIFIFWHLQGNQWDWRKDDGGSEGFVWICPFSPGWYSLIQDRGGGDS